MPSFSDHAAKKLLDLYNNHSHEVGSDLKKTDPVKYASYESTDCITYALKVMSYAFKQNGNASAAQDVWKRGSRGVDLASYLVHNQKWSGIYLNPDINHPRDADPEHSYSHHVAQRSCKYYQVPLEYKVTNYSPTKTSHPAFQKLNKDAGKTALANVDLATLKLVKFGFGISRGGLHTWVYSMGKIYEVHWDQIGAGLYEEVQIENYQWLSGALVVPPDQNYLLTFSAKLKCAP